MTAADAVVAHAGIGTILTALELGKPLLVMPRRAEFGEHRNDHQLATARRFAELGSVIVAFDETELAGRLDELDRVTARPQIGACAPEGLLAALRAFIIGQPPVAAICGPESRRPSHAHRPPCGPVEPCEPRGSVFTATA